MVLKKQKRTKKNSFNIVLKFWFIPLMFIILGFVLAFIHINIEPGITILVYPHNKKEIVSFKTDELLARGKITSKFKAKDNNLGIVAVRFNTHFRINNDTVIFRIRELGKTNWFYENRYKVDQFQPNQFFTFGLPIIDNSEGRVYEFEIESIKGKINDAVALSPIEPVFVTKYQYSRQKITSNSEYALKFLGKKSVNLLTNPDFLLAWLVYNLPVLLYFVWLFLFEKFLNRKYYFALLPIIFMLMVVLSGIANNDIVTIGLTIMWIYFIYLYKFRGVFSFVVSSIFIIFSFCTYYLGLENASKGFSVWAFILLIVGIVNQIVELKFPDKKMIGLSDLRDSIIHQKTSRKKQK